MTNESTGHSEASNLSGELNLEAARALGAAVEAINRVPSREARRNWFFNMHSIGAAWNLSTRKEPHPSLLTAPPAPFSYPGSSKGEPPPTREDGRG